MGVSQSSGNSSGPNLSTPALVVIVALLALLIVWATQHNRVIPIGDQPSPAPTHSAVS